MMHPMEVRESAVVEVLLSTYGVEADVKVPLRLH